MYHDEDMKYNHGKIKREHGILKEFEKILRKIEKMEDVQRIIPWRISRKQQWTSQFVLSFSYETVSGLKYMMKKWGTAQELFLTVSGGKREVVRNLIVELTS